MARPRIKAPQRKTQLIIFRVTPSEYDFLSAVARRAGLSVHTLARHSALSKSKSLVIKRSQASDPALLKRLERIGNNLNQLVRRFHQSGRLSTMLLPLCDEIAKIVYNDIKGTDEL